MKINTQEKALVQINENRVFYKIKKIFSNLFYKRESQNTIIPEEENLSSEIHNQKNVFIESIKNIESKETKLLKLQEQYNFGEIKEEELTIVQLDALCDLYKKQNEELKKSIEIKKQKLDKYKSKK